MIFDSEISSGILSRFSLGILREFPLAIPSNFALEMFPETGFLQISLSDLLQGLLHVTHKMWGEGDFSIM